MSAKEREIEQIHEDYLSLVRETMPTHDTVRDIARSRLRLIELVGEEEQRRLVGQWNSER